MNIFKSIFSVLGFISKPGEAVLDKFVRLKKTGVAVSAGGASGLLIAFANPEFISEITLLVQAVTTLIGVLITAYAKIKSGDITPPSVPPTLLLLITLLFSSMIQETQAAIIAKLKTEIATVLVEEMPENPDTYNLTTGQAALLIMYDGANPSAINQGQSASVQPAHLRFTVFAVSRTNKLKTPGALSCFSLLDTLREKLPGFIPDVAKPHEFLVWTGENFSHQKNGVWYYASTFELKKLFV